MREKWNGFECDKFVFEEYDAIVVIPTEGTENGELAVKTEYWDKFVEAAELDLVKNGALLQKAYKDAGVELEVHMKAGAGHHPHGLENPAPVVAFIMKYC